MITPKPHQISFSKKVHEKLETHGLCYLIGTPRSGKTLTSILAITKTDAKSILVVTKKNAISGWEKFKDFYGGVKFTVINYEIIHKYKDHYDAVIVDEAHNFGAYPKPTQRWKNLASISRFSKYVLLLSGTPYVEGISKVYHQFALSSKSPFKQPTFYRWFKVYGIPKSIWVHGRQVKSYDTCRIEKVEKEISPYVISMDLEDAGLDNKSKPLEILENVEIPKDIKDLCDKLKKFRIINLTDCPIIGKKGKLWSGDYVADSVIKLRSALYQIEGGTLKVDDNTYVSLSNYGGGYKLRYIQDNFKGKNIGIMSSFIGEQEMLKRHFKNVYSATAHAEGVDLSHLDALIIYSETYSGSKHIQRKYRLLNIDNKENKKTNIYYLLSKGAVSEAVYQSVSNKSDFNLRAFELYLLRS